ncbi:MAG: RNA-binding transcriptional accessory protein [Candidatus Omnitrophica bacterium]|nr:RNA-binding transcriptional accessory protein [Candidatus Omnitrophota bacterium]
MNNQLYSLKIAKELGIQPDRVLATVDLLDNDATIPFISRYRKEVTGNLDEVAVGAIRDRVEQLRELDKRRATVIESITQQGKMTDALRAKISAAETLAVLEDIYLPYKPKRRTRAMVAKEKGLEPLALKIFEQTGISKTDLDQLTAGFVDAKKKVNSVEEALSGSRDIIAEIMNENTDLRAKLRVLFQEKAMIQSKVIKNKEEAGSKFRDYFDWEELGKTAPSHRILAIRRGEKEEFLSVRFQPPEEAAIEIIDEMFLISEGADGDQVELAIDDCYKRLLCPSMETEYRLELKKRADLEAIGIFKNNLAELLMAPPLGQKNVLAIDPGQRTGCKIVCLDRQGQLLRHTVIYLCGSDYQKDEAIAIIRDLCKKHKTEVIAIGNGTASRETEVFIRSLKLPPEIIIVLVNESGASIYSASDVAREEFPDQDVTVRGAVSIGRRLMDPLAELVKIDPKSIGVGQYQHDVDQAQLKNSLSDIVISCVNQVGVELNTASKQLLIYVSGIGPTRAQAIIDHRNAKGPFKNRAALKKVTGLGPKAFEQAAGFLRIIDSDNPLDASAVHPESYGLVEQMAKDIGCSIKDLIIDEKLRGKIELKKYVTATIGLPTLTDIKAELAKPGRDPRPPFQLFSFKEGVEKIEDLQPGMKLPGVVTNVTAFGAFVDVGVHQDGLVHISQLADHYVKDANEAVKVHQKVQVTVLEIDLPRRRIALSLRKNPR